MKKVKQMYKPSCRLTQFVSDLQLSLRTFVSIALKDLLFHPQGFQSGAETILINFLAEK
jgi:hypothetical protein